MLELTSNTPAAGKTHLLYLLTAAAVLPQISKPKSADDGAPSRAWDQNPQIGTAVIVDTDNRFDIKRLAEVMSSYYHSYHLDPTGESPSDKGGLPTEVLHALKHIHFFCPQSLASLLATLQGLPSYLLDISQHHSAHRPLTLLAIDTITAFYWPERYAQETASLPTDVGDQYQKRPPSLYAELVTAVKAIQTQFICPVVVTSWSLSAAKQSESSISIPGVNSNMPKSLRPLLPGIWNQFVTARMNVYREPVKKFPPGMTLEQAERERKQRQEVIERNLFRAEVDWWSSEMWSDGLKEKLRRDAKLRGFGFVIKEAGFTVDE